MSSSLQDVASDCKREYLGDSVYVEVTEDGMLRLTTSDGEQVSNEIYLERFVFANLIRYAARQDVYLFNQPRSE